MLLLRKFKKEKSKRRRALITALFLVWLFFLPGRPALAQEEIGLTCPLEKEVPLGQLVPQIELMSSEILGAGQNIIQASSRLLKAGKKMVELANSCQTENCTAACRQIFVLSANIPADLSGFCTEGYTCEHQEPRFFLQARQDNDPNIPLLGCETLPDGQVGTTAEHWYEIATWKEKTNGRACDIDSTAECPGAYCYPCDDPVTKKEEKWCPGGGSRRIFLGSEICQEIYQDGGLCTGLSCSGTFFTIIPEAGYAVFKWTDNFTHWLTCYNSCYTETGDSGECNIDWSEPACQAEPCSGDACDFAAIGEEKVKTQAAFWTIEENLQKIKAIFDKKVLSLPLFGNVCEWPFMNLVCGIFGGRPERTLIAEIYSRSYQTARECFNEPADYEKIFTGEKAEKALLRCQELMPSSLRGCLFNNFYCCQTKQ